MPSVARLSHVACGKAAKAAVAEACVRLCLKNIGGAAAKILERAGERVADAEVEGVLHQRAPHEKLHRQVVHLALGRGALSNRVQAREDLADDDGRGRKTCSSVAVSAVTPKCAQSLSAMALRSSSREI